MEKRENRHGAILPITWREDCVLIPYILYFYTATTSATCRTRLKVITLCSVFHYIFNT